MSNPRKLFLSTLFRILDLRQIPYCVLRNYRDIYEDLTSDVDLAVEPERIDDLKQCLGEAAVASNHHFVLRARYVNFSYVYWHPEAGFIRIDLQTEVRWRIFPVLTAKSLVGLRRKQGLFYVPHPRHESAVLFVTAIWRRNLSDRYRQQLARLYQELADRGSFAAGGSLMPKPDPAGGTAAPPAAPGAIRQLQRTFHAAFGVVGEKLAECQGNILPSAPPVGLWKEARRSLVRNAFCDGPTRRACLAYLVSDLRRGWERLHEPPGISLLFASAARSARKFDEFFDKIRFLYPSEKSVIHAIELGSGHGASARLSLRRRLTRLYALFKGGLFLRFYGVAQDRDLAQVLRTRARYLYPSRTFACVEDSRFETCLVDEQTGFMAEFSPAGPGPVPDERIIRFISRILEEHRRRESKTARKARGAWVVLLGLDGSGKTTVARKLCCLGPDQQRFRSIRYFHWQPRLFGNDSLPLPDFKPAPRKPELRRTPLRSLCSAARLFKNALLANLTYWLRIRSWLGRDALILVDRYYYNYFLDPVSVKYYGPAWLLRWGRRFFPRPDLVVVLKAPATVLLARKQELSREQVLQQSLALDRLHFDARRVLELDATQAPLDLARAILAEAAEMR